MFVPSPQQALHTLNKKSPPVLSICIPTYNSASLLKVMLEALLPQVALTNGKVEVWVSDNASEDNTAKIVSAAQQHGPVNYWCHQKNTGPVNNVISSATKLACGEYVWLLGSHSLIMPGALKLVLDVLEKNKQFDLFYTNFRCANYPEHWPVTVPGGYSGEFSYLANEDKGKREITHWYELIKSSSSLCTQLYAHIVKQSIWQEFWGDEYFEEDYVDGKTTYPHTYMIAATSLHKPTYYIGSPVITIFEGAQHWRALLTRGKVYIQGLPDLIKLFERKGLPAERLKEAQDFNKRLLYQVASSYFYRSGENRRQIWGLLILKTSRSPYLVPIVWKAFLDAERSIFSRAINRWMRFLKIYYQYIFWRC